MTLIRKLKQTEIGAIPEEWSFEPLIKHAEIIMGQSPESKFYNNTGEGIVFLQGIRTFGEKYPTYDTYTTKITKKAKEGSVLLSVRAPVGEVNIATKDVCIGRGLMAINSKNNEFIYQLLKAFKPYLVGKETGTVYGSVTKNDIAELKLPFPPQSEQLKIAEILSSLDDKIELNRRINANLEAMASALFKKWFVDFEFPNKEGKPYKTNNGKMFVSELGVIPKEWSVKQAQEIFDFVKGIEPGNKNYFTVSFEEAIPFFRIADLFNGNQAKNFIDRSIANTVTMNHNDVMIATDGTVGRVAIGLYGSYSGGIKKVLSKDQSISNSFIYLWLKSNLVQDKLEEYASNATTIAHASSAIKDLKVIYNKEIIREFCALSQPIFEIIINNLIENIKIKKVMDSLLPRMISGKIRVT